MKFPKLPDKIGGSATVTGMIYSSVIFMTFFGVVITATIALIVFGGEEEGNLGLQIVEEVRGFGEWLLAAIAGALGIRTGSKNLGGKGNDPVIIQQSDTPSQDLTDAHPPV